MISTQANEAEAAIYVSYGVGGCRLARSLHNTHGANRVSPLLSRVASPCTP